MHKRLTPWRASIEFLIGSACALHVLATVGSAAALKDSADSLFI